MPKKTSPQRQHHAVAPSGGLSRKPKRAAAPQPERTRRTPGKPPSEAPVHAHLTAPRSVKITRSLVGIAESVVPEHLRGLGHVVGEGAPGVALASKMNAAGATAEQEDALTASIAKELGIDAPLASKDSLSGDVEFVEQTELGPRPTVVQVRGGKVARVLKRAVVSRRSGGTRSE